ncbi:MAG: hypothetical protein LBR63_00760 [Citrobacter amalonaticus]|jgi:hypothetical protein|nr:hypothetical protein [Citrobacter amalonaticus]
MRKFLFIPLLLSSSFAFSANSVSEYQYRCERQHERFVDMVDCLSRSVKADSYTYDSKQARLYIASANRLAAKVKRGQMYEEDAVLELAEVYRRADNDYRAMNEEQRKRNMNPLEKMLSGTQTTSCTKYDTSVTCSSY